MKPVRCHHALVVIEKCLSRITEIREVSEKERERVYHRPKTEIREKTQDITA